MHNQNKLTNKLCAILKKKKVKCKFTTHFNSEKEEFNLLHEHLPLDLTGKGDL